MILADRVERKHNIILSSHAVFCLAEASEYWPSRG